MHTLFWISFSLLFYTYFGYGLLLLLYNSFQKKSTGLKSDFFPAVTVLVPAYNEEKIIREKIQNSLWLHYPSEKLSFVFITDGSTDDTPSIIREHKRIKLLHQATREGKSAAINRAMKEITSPIVVFTDANTMLNPESIKKLVRHFKEEKVGGVSGEKRIVDVDHSAVGFGEKLYWQYESMLKKANARFYTIVGAAGELFAIRRSLFEPLNENIILDDFVISASICQKGYRFGYEEEAVAVETSSISMKEEGKRKIRISAGSFQALLLLMDLLNPFKNFKVSFQYISHRVLRWVVCPLLLPVFFLSSAFLFFQDFNIFYAMFFWTQVGFYFLALLGCLLSEKHIARTLLVPYYFTFMVFSQYVGFYRYVTKAQTVHWEKAVRR